MEGGIDLPIILNETKAYSNVLNGININKDIVPESERKNLSHEIVKCLKEFKDPLDGTCIMKTVMLKQDSYAASDKNAPDIIFEFDENYHVGYEIQLKSNDYFKYMEREKIEFFTGNHRRNGVFIAFGGDLESINLQNKDINITDIYSTVLSLFNVDIPVGVDGKTLC